MKGAHLSWQWFWLSLLIPNAMHPAYECRHSTRVQLPITGSTSFIRYRVPRVNRRTRRRLVAII